MRQIRWRWVQYSAPASVRVQALGCTVGCIGERLSASSWSCPSFSQLPPLGCGRCVRAREATAQRLGLDSEDSAGIIVQRGGR